MAKKECNYREKSCVFEHKGRKFESGGAEVVGDRIVAYLGKNGILTTWHGKKIGTYRIVSSWATPRSWISSHQYQVEAIVKGRIYTGRSTGVGMVFKGKLKRGK
jgi:hypothetical protein